MRFPHRRTSLQLPRFLETPLPDCFRERAAIDRALASNLEVLGGSLAAIGDFFVFHGLSFVKRRKACFLNRRNMNKNVFTASRGLDESEALGRVEPLHSTFSHHVVSAGSKNKADRRSPQTGMSDLSKIRGLGGA